MVLDGPLHLEKAPRFRSVQDLLYSRMEACLREIESTSVRAGLRLWKLYNHGFVVRTPSVTIGFDLVPGWLLEEGAPEIVGMPSSWCERLADQVDLLTISHRHEDHWEPRIVARTLDRHAPVLADAAAAAAMPAPGPRPVLPSLDNPRFRRLSVPGGSDVEFLALPGHQGEISNSVFVIRTREGTTIVHTGDLYSESDLGWLDGVGEMFPVDLLLVNCWTLDMSRLVRGIRPCLVVAGHEVEMSHQPSHRESYWRTFQIFRDMAVDARPLFWGEGFAYAG
jgi:L-ascorbate metabolism protein UlaG (beta-lactamase superfamily)